MNLYENASQTIEKSRSVFNCVMIFFQLSIQNVRHDLSVKQPRITSLEKIRKNGILSLRPKKKLYSTSKRKKKIFRIFFLDKLDFLCF